MSNVRMIYLVASLSTLLACGKENSPSAHASQSEDAVAGGFLSDDFFQYDDQVVAMDDKAMASFVSSLDFFYYQKDKEAVTTLDTPLGLTEESTSRCEIKQDSIVLGDDKKSLTMSYVFDDTDCTDVKDTYLNKMRVFITIACSDTDLSNQAENSVRKFLYTIGAREFCGDDKTQKTFINAEYERISSTTSAKVSGGLMQGNGNACVATNDGGAYKTGDCSFLQKTVVTDLASKDAKVTKLAVLKAKDLVAKSAGRYYGEGKVSMQINNWKGDMTYTSDNVSPTYAVDAGGKTINGSFQAGIYDDTKK